MRKEPLAALVERLPTDWIRNYVTTFEVGRVQGYPEKRFVNARGQCCLVGALAGARTARAMIASPLWRRFLGSELEEISRRFEDLEVTGQEFYEEALLALARRAPGGRARRARTH